MPNKVKLELCPKCGSVPRLSISRQGFGRSSHAVYGYVCSNTDCFASYAFACYMDQETALKEWNKKAQWKKQLKEWSEELDSCSCGGKADLVYEEYSGKGFWFVRCKECGKGLSALDSMGAIIEAWNRRVKDAE